MKNILHVISSPREEAFSIKLGNAIAGQLQENDEQAVVTEVNLAKDPFPHLDDFQIKALRTPADLLDPTQKKALTRSEQAIEQLKQADIILISVPLFNFGIPSTLKSWIDNILRAGHTFSYDENGPKGLLQGKKVYLAIATGGVYSEGPAKGLDFAVPYLKAVLGFIGLTDVKTVRVEGTAMSDLQGNALERAIASIEHNWA